jgi:hypothetical protein
MRPHYPGTAQVVTKPLPEQSAFSFPFTNHFCIIIALYQFQINDEIKAARIEATKAYNHVR